MKLCLLTALTLVLVLAAVEHVHAEAAPASIVVGLPMDSFILINGTRHYGTTFHASVGSRVCLANTIVYETPESRYRFSFWVLDGLFLAGEPCITVEKPGTYRAVYLKEHLVRVFSDPLLFSYEFWVEYSSIFNYTAPAEVPSDDKLYRFRFWGGEVVSANHTVSVAVTRPMRLVAYYVPHYPLYISNTLIGYFPYGYVYYYIAKVEEESVVRRIASRVVVIGGEVITVDDNIYAIMVTGKTVAIPIFKTYYRVRVETPHGVKDEWVEAGSYYTVAVPRTVERGDVIHSFVRLEGDAVSDLHTLAVRVEKPIYVKAVYTKMYKVTVISPTGEKTRWVEEGGTLYIYEPAQLAGIVTARTLVGFLVDGVLVSPVVPGTLKLERVDRPITVVAVYEDSLLWRNIAVIALFLLTIVAAYILLSRRSRT